MSSRDPLFHGKRESQWIKGLGYNDDSQVELWRGFGPEGVNVLVRGLQGAARPGDRLYRRAYRQIGRVLPARFLRRLPPPRMDLTRPTRMCVVDLLAHLGSDALAATPVMIRELRDESPSVCQLAITFFTAGEDSNAPLNKMDKRTKLALLPEFLHAMDDSQWGVRNNAIVALRYYQEQADVVVPVLTKALQDPQPAVRALAAKTLQRLDPTRRASVTPR